MNFRALDKVRPLLEKYPINTGRPLEEDMQTKQLLQELLKVDLLCQPNFNESLLFVGPEKVSYPVIYISLYSYIVYQTLLRSIIFIADSFEISSLYY